MVLSPLERQRILDESQKSVETDNEIIVEILEEVSKKKKKRVP